MVPWIKNLGGPVPPVPMVVAPMRSTVAGETVRLPCCQNKQKNHNLVLILQVTIACIRLFCCKPVDFK
jgi:hypothetical protein